VGMDGYRGVLFAKLVAGFTFLSSGFSGSTFAFPATIKGIELVGPCQSGGVQFAQREEQPFQAKPASRVGYWPVEWTNG
ncbi:MAG: hypothetical protein ACREQV_00330, partial [Candidatus Binatia bacterium]